jgi:glycerol-3-phosphate dehydrogenase
VHNEGAATLEDVLYRRTRVALYEPEHKEAVLVPIAQHMAGLLEWSEPETRAQVERARARLAADLEFVTEPE